MSLSKTCCEILEAESAEVKISLPSTKYVSASADVLQSDLRFIKVLGKGSYGKVMLAEKKDSEDLYAVKVVRKDRIAGDKIARLAINEKNVMILTKNNPFFTTLHTYFQTPERLYFVMDFENGGDLSFHLRRSQKFGETRAAFYAAEIVIALQFLHRNAIIYRDLKLANVLLDGNGHCKLTDFGLSKLGMSDNIMTQSYCGTLDYLAPILIQGLKYNKSIDWWALGVLIYKMIDGHAPFNALNYGEFLDSIVNADVEFSSLFSFQAISLLEGLMEKFPELRIGNTSDEQKIRSHPFFKHIDWTALELRQIEAPFIPSIVTEGDTSNFDMEFIDQNPVLSMVSNDACSVDQSEFGDFPWID